MKWWQNKDIVGCVDAWEGAVVIFVFLLSTYLSANATVFVKLRTNTRVLIWPQVIKCRAWLFASNNTYTSLLPCLPTHVSYRLNILFDKNRSRLRNSLWRVKKLWLLNDIKILLWIFHNCFQVLQRFSFNWIKAMKSSLVKVCLLLVLVRLTKGKWKTNFRWFVHIRSPRYVNDTFLLASKVFKNTSRD